MNEVINMEIYKDAVEFREAIFKLNNGDVSASVMEYYEELFEVHELNQLNCDAMSATVSSDNLDPK